MKIRGAPSVDSLSKKPGMRYTEQLMSQRVKIISLNIQHGWNSDNPVPFSFRRREILANLDKIVELLNKHRPDVALLQEVDLISPLTSRIDQLRYIASRVGYLHRAHGASSEWRLGDRIVYSAGCGILSRFPITTSENVKFDQSLPTLRKGFLIATLDLPPGKKLTVVSAHLPPFDILNVRSKRIQIEKIAQALNGRGPFVIGGDLNMSLSLVGRKNFRILTEQLRVRTHRDVLEPRFATYPARDPRRKIDWIFASPEFAMTDYSVLPDRVSDHLAVGTTITL